MNSDTLWFVKNFESPNGKRQQRNAIYLEKNVFFFPANLILGRRPFRPKIESF